MPTGSPTAGNPFFRFTTFKGQPIDIVDGKIHNVTPTGTDQETWQRDPHGYDYYDYIKTSHPELSI